MDEHILLIDKPVGWTSFDVVAKIRGKIRVQYQAEGIKPTKRQLRVGHAGTLDPFATGLLIILLGEECKRAGEFLKLDKVYEATFTLGVTSSTGDPEGELTPFSDIVPTLEAVEEAAQRFVGDSMQRPPIFSAIKINGHRAYHLARQNKEVDIPARPIHIYSIDILSYEYPQLKIRTHVGSGTYIRSLAVDIGEALGTGAYCSELRRTQIAEWNIADARSVESLTLSK
jgi:tRNA pseudouridine55 synthase